MFLAWADSGPASKYPFVVTKGTLVDAAVSSPAWPLENRGIATDVDFCAARRENGDSAAESWAALLAAQKKLVYLRHRLHWLGAAAAERWDGNSCGSKAGKRGSRAGQLTNQHSSSFFSPVKGPKATSSAWVDRNAGKRSSEVDELPSTRYPALELGLTSHASTGHQRACVTA